MVKVWNQEVTSIGYGLASLTVGANTPSEEQAFDCLRTAAELGCLVWNAGEFYGPPTHNSLTLLNRFYAKYPEYAEQVILNVKGAARPDFTVNGDPEFVKKSVENCLSLLGGKGKVSMYETARIDVNIPLEIQLNTLKELQNQGKIAGIALTEVNAETIRKAAKLVDIAAVEIELSLWCVDPLRNSILTTCAELGIPVLSYCPLGRGVLTGSVVSVEDIPQGDYRHLFPRYQPNSLAQNGKLVQEVKKLAQKKGCTTAQVSLGWLLGLSNQKDMPVILPIPGSDPEIEEGNNFD
ncbi:MAG: hypothetical protein Q9190_005423 [Brigantiaea leucoxantha]